MVSRSSWGNWEGHSSGRVDRTSSETGRRARKQLWSSVLELKALSLGTVGGRVCHI